MNRDQFDCKFKQYQTLRAPEDGGVNCPENSEARMTTRSNPPQVVAVGPRGFSLLLDGMPRFLAFRDHPAFATASGAQLRHVQRRQPNRLFWPELGVSLEIDPRPKGNRPAEMNGALGSAAPAV